MNVGKRQVIAEKIGSTVRALELLGFDDYAVTPPRNQREKGNKSPRVVRVNVGEKSPLRIYSGTGGHTWANRPDGSPIPGIVSVEDVYKYLADFRDGLVEQKKRKTTKTKAPSRRS